MCSSLLPSKTLPKRSSRRRSIPVRSRPRRSVMHCALAGTRSPNHLCCRACCTGIMPDCRSDGSGPMRGKDSRHASGHRLLTCALSEAGHRCRSRDATAFRGHGRFLDYGGRIRPHRDDSSLRRRRFRPGSRYPDLLPRHRRQNRLRNCSRRRDSASRRSDRRPGSGRSSGSGPRRNGSDPNR